MVGRPEVDEEETEEGVEVKVEVEVGARTHTHPHIHRQSGSPQTSTAGGDDGDTPELHRSGCWGRLSVGGDRCRPGH
jgi:hypothetical protein